MRRLCHSSEIAADADQRGPRAAVRAAQHRIRYDARITELLQLDKKVRHEFIKVCGAVVEEQQLRKRFIERRAVSFIRRIDEEGKVLLSVVPHDKLDRVQLQHQAAAAVPRNELSKDPKCLLDDLWILRPVAQVVPQLSHNHLDHHLVATEPQLRKHTLVHLLLLRWPRRPHRHRGRSVRRDNNPNDRTRLAPSRGGGGVHCGHTPMLPNIRTVKCAEELEEGHLEKAVALPRGAVLPHPLIRAVGKDEDAAAELRICELIIRSFFQVHRRELPIQERGDDVDEPPRLLLVDVLHRRRRGGWPRE